MKNIKSLRAVFIILGILTSSVVGAQSSNFNNGTVTPVQLGSIIFNAGVGVGTGYEGDYYNHAFGTKIAVEWGLWQAGPGVVTLGVEAGGSYSNGGYYDDYKSHTFVGAARSAWHYGWRVKGLDTYGGLSTGLGTHHYSYNNNQLGYSNTETFFAFGAFAGASYFISPAFGFNVEAGYDITNFQAGIILKLR